MFERTDHLAHPKISFTCLENKQFQLLKKIVSYIFAKKTEEPFWAILTVPWATMSHNDPLWSTVIQNIYTMSHVDPKHS